MRYSPRRLVGSVRRRLRGLIRSRHYRLGQHPLLNQVLFVSFDGKVAADSPLDILKELQRKDAKLKFLWTVNSAAVRSNSSAQVVPQNCIPVEYESKEWLAALAQSRYLVSNNLLPWYFKKAPGQVYLQTWHGTPLKRLANDIGNGSVSSTYLANIARESAAWNYLVSPSEFASSAFRSAFGYAGELLQFGYPRNDRLVNQTIDVDKVRARLGIDDPKVKLVLYAPTWRDYKVSAAGDWEAITYLSESLRLPEGFRLLFRGHSATLKTHSAAIAGSALDVTGHPDIIELLAIADVLVTDFSSTMFDFSITGKPILFFAPDFERYRSERGFYFDFEAEAPGPIFRDETGLIEALGRLDEISAEYGQRYKDWQQKFNQLEVGTAAARVVQVVFSKA